MRLIGRMHGRGWYARTSGLFLMDRLRRENWDSGKRRLERRRRQTSRGRVAATPLVI